jgi:hypothetical protein
VRRYGDFEWLSDQLANTYPGIIIPPVPEKQAVGRFSPDFVEQRRRGLERFLLKISMHPVLVESHHFITFLTGTPPNKNNYAILIQRKQLINYLLILMKPMTLPLAQPSLLLNKRRLRRLEDPV